MEFMGGLACVPSLVGSNGHLLWQSQQEQTSGRFKVHLLHTQLHAVRHSWQTLPDLRTVPPTGHLVEAAQGMLSDVTLSL